MPGINMMPSGSTLQIPLDACTNFSGKAGNAQVTLTWTDPKDKYATPEGETAQDPDQLVSVWEYTQIIRKTGSQPTGPHDGELVVSSSVRDQYATNGFVDTGLTNDTLYYYAAFAYNTDGVASEGAFTSATPMAGTPLSELAEGTLIKILENGSPVEFYLAKHNYEPTLNGEGRELVVRRNNYTQSSFGYDSSNYNSYVDGDLDVLLNTNYKNVFSQSIQNLIGTTRFKVSRGGQNGGIILTPERFAFALSTTEYGKKGLYASVEGSELPIAETINQISSRSWTRSSANVSYWDEAYTMQQGVAGAHSTNNSAGARPCFTLPSTALVDQNLNLIES